MQQHTPVSRNPRIGDNSSLMETTAATPSAGDRQQLTMKGGRNSSDDCPEESMDDGGRQKKKKTQRDGGSCTNGGNAAVEEWTRWWSLSSPERKNGRSASTAVVLNVRWLIVSSGCSGSKFVVVASVPEVEEGGWRPVEGI